MKKINDANAEIPDYLGLSDEISPWRSDIYIAVNKEVPNAQMVRISGAFLTKVFEGNYKDMKKWIEQMKAYVKSKDREMKKMYFYYTTCPKCAKHYGKNYVVIFAQV